MVGFRLVLLACCFVCLRKTLECPLDALEATLLLAHLRGPARSLVRCFYNGLNLHFNLSGFAVAEWRVVAAGSPAINR